VYEKGTKIVHDLESLIGKWHEKFSNYQEAITNQEATLVRNGTQRRHARADSPEKHPELLQDYLEVERAMHERIFHGRALWELEVGLIQLQHQQHVAKLRQQYLVRQAFLRLTLVRMV